MPCFCVESKGVLETNRKDGDGLRKRKISHLGSLDKTEAEDDEEGEEEDFQLPQREEETVFSLNKCLLASVILLGLGTIFFSGEQEAFFLFWSKDFGLSGFIINAVHSMFR